MSAPLVVAVEGIALWAPRLPGWEAARAILRGEAPAPDAPLPRPAPTMLAPTERRRAPDTVALALEVAQAACAATRQCRFPFPQGFPKVNVSVYPVKAKPEFVAAPAGICLF